MRDNAFLNACLVDGGAERKSSKPVRRRAVLAAFVFETAMISCMAIWPLVKPVNSPPEFVLFPRFPYRGDIVQMQPARPSPRAERQPAWAAPIFSPPLIPAHIFRSAVSTMQNQTPSVADFMPGTGADFPGVPGGIGDDTIVPPKPAPVRVIRRSESIVELKVLVGRDGRVQSVRVLSGSPMLAAAAKSAVEQWRYRPTILDGQSVEVETHVTVNFILNE